MAQFEASVMLARPVEEVFDFLTQPARVLEILPEDSGVTYTSVPERLVLGSRVEFDLKGFGPVQNVIHEVSAFDAPTWFVERQVKGPLPHWEHTHLLEVVGGRVRVWDRIEFEPPGGLAGLLITEGRIRHSLEKGFAHRHRRLREILEGV